MKTIFKNITEEINTDRIDFNAFYRSVLASIPRIRYQYDCINRQISSLALLKYSFGISTMDQYLKIIDLTSCKNDLVVIHNSFGDWYKGLRKEWKAIYVAYFILKDTKICKHISDHYMRIIIEMGKSFVEYLKVYTYFNERELVNNDFIYSLYCSRINECVGHKHKNKKLGGKKKHDNSANEKRHCRCVQNKNMEK